ncbi:MAG: uridine kinase, partial [Jatrophihabitantaceae bacterium]
HEVAASVLESLPLLGRAGVQIRAESFWHDASVRLEYGHQDVDAYLSWLDAGAMRREVLVPLGPDGSGAYLPSLRDPATNRATREPTRVAGPGTIVIVSGCFLLGRGLPFDVTVHLAMSTAARARRTPSQNAWVLPAFDRYDSETRPEELADIAVRTNDPKHPAIRID